MYELMKVKLHVIAQAQPPSLRSPLQYGTRHSSLHTGAYKLTLPEAREEFGNSL